MIHHLTALVHRSRRQRQPVAVVTVLAYNPRDIRAIQIIASWARHDLSYPPIANSRTAS